MRAELRDEVQNIPGPTPHGWGDTKEQTQLAEEDPAQRASDCFPQPAGDLRDVFSWWLGSAGVAFGLNGLKDISQPK